MWADHLHIEAVIGNRVGIGFGYEKEIAAFLLNSKGAIVRTRAKALYSAVELAHIDEALLSSILAQGLEESPCERRMHPRLAVKGLTQPTRRYVEARRRSHLAGDE
jgi:hypothetical protein